MKTVYPFTNNIKNLLSQAREDYRSASIALVYKFKERKRKLVFCCVELLPEWFEIPKEIDVSKKIDGFELNFRRIIFDSPVEALQWYLQIQSNTEIDLPATTLDIEKGWDKKERKISLEEMGEEPKLPYFTFPGIGKAWHDVSSIWGDYGGGFRWHQKRRLSELDPSELFESKKGISESRDWLKSHLPFDIFTRPLMMGSAHLVLVNPLLRHVSFRPSGDDPKKLVLNIKYGRGQSNHPLKAYVREYRPCGSTQFLDFEISSPTMVVECPYEFHYVGLDIVCPERGLIYSQKPTPYMKQISIGMGIITKQRVVKIPKIGRNKNEEEFRAGVVGMVDKIMVGDTSPLEEALPVVIKEKYRVKSINLANDLDQAWFNGNQDEAVSYVKNIVTKAQGDILFVDPYFSFIELSRYALAVSDGNISIRILTSNAFLKTSELIDNKEKKHLDLLWNHFNNVLKQDSSLKIEIRVMMGKKPDVHDRFIKTRDNVWMLGSSLNEFGNRGTMAIRLPYSNLIASEVESAWNVAKPLEFLVNEAKKIDLMKKRYSMKAFLARLQIQWNKLWKKI